MVFCLAHLGFSRERDIRLMTLKEYRLQLKAYQYRELNKLRTISEQAWLNHLVSLTDKKGKFVYKKLKDLFDYDKERKRIERAGQLSAKQERLLKIAQIAQEYEGKESD